MLGASRGDGESQPGTLGPRRPEWSARAYRSVCHATGAFLISVLRGGRPRAGPVGCAVKLGSAMRSERARLDLRAGELTGDR